MAFTDTAMYSMRCDRFIVRYHIRIGDGARPNRAMCIELLLEIQFELEKDLYQFAALAAMLTVCLEGVFLIAGLCVGHRGEEFPLMSLDVIRKYYLMEQPPDPQLANVFIGLHGRVKGEALHEECHLVLITATARSGLQPRLWVGRAIKVYERMGIQSGWMFQHMKGAHSSTRWGV
jgi:hypothetical protein